MEPLRASIYAAQRFRESIAVERSNKIKHSVINELPDGYKETPSCFIDRPMKIIFNIGLFSLMMFEGYRIIHKSSFFDELISKYSQCSTRHILVEYFLFMISALCLYFVFTRRQHEKLHYKAMIYMGADAKDAHIEMNIVSPNVRCEKYFCKRDFVQIALAPLITIGILYGGLSWLAFYWRCEFLYAIFWTNLSFNTSGSAGDIYDAIKVLFSPKSVIVRDNGTGIIRYTLKSDKQ